MLMHTFNQHSGDRGSGSLWVWGHPDPVPGQSGLHTEKSYYKTKQKNKKNPANLYTFGEICCIMW